MANINKKSGSLDHSGQPKFDGSIVGLDKNDKVVQNECSLKWSKKFLGTNFQNYAFKILLITKESLE